MSDTRDDSADDFEDLDYGDDGVDEKPEESTQDLHERMRRQAKVGRKAAIARNAARQPKMSLLRYGAFAVLAIAALSMVLYALGTSSSHEAKLADGSARINELNRALVAGEDQVESLPSAEELAPALAKAVSKADDLAEVQNDMAGLNLKAGDAAGLAEYGEMVEASKKYYTAGSLTGGSFLPQGQWYQPYMPGTNEDGDASWVRVPSQDWGWEVIPLKDVDRSGNVSVAWRAVFTTGENQGMMLAWVTGKFDSARGEFYEMSTGHTPQGWARTGATNSPDVFGQGEVEDLAPPESQKEIDDAAAKALERERDKSGSSGSSGSSRENSDKDSSSDKGSGSAPTADSGLDPKKGE